MDVTLNSTLSWDPIVGAEFQVQVLDAVNAPLVAPINNGTVSFISVGLLLLGLPGGTYKLQVRAALPGGGLPSPWSSITVTLVGFAAPTGLVIT